MEACKEYDIVWIQSTPSIAAIYYHRELSKSHILYCPDVDTSPQQPRHVAKSILNVLDSNEKKLAIYFTHPCTLKRRETIFKFLLKNKPELSSFCLSIPTTLLQTNLLLGWSAEIKNVLWQRRCAIALDPDAFSTFTPPTQISGQFECTHYLNEFAISKKKFGKKSLIVDLSNDMISFDIHNGIQFNHCVDHSIKGWIRAAASTPRTLIWIIDEKSLYGEHINNVIQDKRTSLLKKYREKLFSSIEAFATTIPIYCYLINCFNTSLFNLSEYLAQIQHRHHLCLSKTILLKRCQEKELLNHGHLSKIKPVYLNKFPVFIESKWESIYLKYFSEMKSNGEDGIWYISPELLDIDTSNENYVTPLLNKEDEIKSELTISENIGIDDNIHTVSAQSIGVFEQWTKLIREAAAKDEDVSYSTDYNSSLFSRVIASLTTQKIKDYIADDSMFEQDIATLSVLFDAQYTLLDNRNMSLSVKAQGSSEILYLITIEFDHHTDIKQALCSCPTGASGRCKHCVDTLQYLLDSPQDFTLSKSTELQQCASYNSDSSSTRKRSFRESQDEEEDGHADGDEKKKNKSSESSSLDTDASSNKGDGKQLITATVQSSIKETYSTAPFGSNPSSSENNSNSFSSNSLPSIHSSVYCSASSKSFESSISFPTLPSSGSLGMTSSNSSRKESSYQPSSDDAALPYISTVEESSQSLEEEGQRSRVREAQGSIGDATQYYNPDNEENASTQYYNPDDEENASTQYYDPNEKGEDTTTHPVGGLTIVLDDSDEEESTQPYSADALPTQYYSSNSSHELDATQPYSSEEAPTQPYGSATEDEEDLGDDILQESEAFNTIREDVRGRSRSSSRSETDSTREWLSDLL